MFSLDMIIASAVIGAFASLAVVTAFDPGPIGRRVLRSGLPLALIVGLSILAYRAAANTASLNDDPMPFVSPNDVLCPVFTYVCVGLYGGVTGAAREAFWPRDHLLLTLVSLYVNIVTI